MNTKQIIEKLQDCKTGEQFFELQKEFTAAGIKGNAGYSFEDNITFIDADIISKIVSRMQEENISVNQMAKAIGYPRTNLQMALKNKTRPIPMKYLNRILGILQLFP